MNGCTSTRPYIQLTPIQCDCLDGEFTEFEFETTPKTSTYSTVFGDIYLCMVMLFVTPPHFFTLIFISIAVYIYLRQLLPIFKAQSFSETSNLQQGCTGQYKCVHKHPSLYIKVLVAEWLKQASQ